MSTLKDINKNRVTGERLPRYVNDLLLLLEDWHPSDGDTAGSDKSEELETSQAQKSIPCLSSFAERGSSKSLDKHTEMVQLRLRHPGRRLLKKNPSTAAETEYFPSDAEGAQKEAEGGEGEQPDQPPANPKPHCPKTCKAKSSSDPILWAFADTAFKQVGSGKPIETKNWRPATGFKEYFWPYGTTLLSEQVILAEPADAMMRRPSSNDLKKRPSSNNLMKRPGASSANMHAEWKKRHSQIYHSEKKKFVAALKSQGKAINPLEVKAHVKSKCEAGKRRFFQT